MRGTKNARIVTELGYEKKCSTCGDFWPEDTEFFYWNAPQNRYYAECIACYSQRRKNERAARKQGRAVTLVAAGAH